MDVIIPLAGKGTRLRPHTHSMPKPMISVAGKPMIGHILDKLKEIKIDNLIMVTGDMDEQIKSYVQTNYDYKTHYVKQTELLGDGHAINLAKNHVKNDVLIIFSDTLFVTNLKHDLLDKENIDSIVWTKETSDPRRFGIVTIENGQIVEIEEKPQFPKSNLAVVGMYYFSNPQTLFSYLQQVIDKKMVSSGGEYRLADALKLMLEDKKKIRAANIQEWLDCGKTETLLHTNEYLLRHGYSRYEEKQNVVIIPPVFIDPTAKITTSIIGPNVSIAAGVMIRHSIIENSIVSRDAKIENMSLHSSIIGDRAHIGGKPKSVNMGADSEFCYAEKNG